MGFYYQLDYSLYVGTNMVRLCMKLGVVKFRSVQECCVLTSKGAQGYSVEFILENKAVVNTWS